MGPKTSDFGSIFGPIPVKTVRRPMIKEDFVYADENHDNMIDWEEVAANRCLQFWNPLPVYFRLGRFTATSGHLIFCEQKEFLYSKASDTFN